MQSDRDAALEKVLTAYDALARAEEQAAATLEAALKHWDAAELVKLGLPGVGGRQRRARSTRPRTQPSVGRRPREQDAGALATAGNEHNGGGE
jgi:hypothetical protein